jgi:hypothetical protein
MDPSSHSDAPRGSWYMICFFLEPNYDLVKIDIMEIVVTS